MSDIPGRLDRCGRPGRDFQRRRCHGRRRRHQAEQRARAALDKVGLADRAGARPLALSGGEQQRVSIARAIVNRPQVILADEPTANLDRASANKVLDALKAFHSVGVTCLISSHDEQMLDAAARVIHLNQGRLEVAP